MRQMRWQSATTFLAGALALLMPAIDALADEAASSSNQDVTTDDRGPRPQPRHSMSFKLGSAEVAQRPNQRIDLPADSVTASADDLIERVATDRMVEKPERIFALRRNAQLRLRDDSMIAAAENAVIRVQYRDASKTAVEAITADLTGNVRCTFHQVRASAEKLRICFWSSRDPTTKNRSAAWTVQGRAVLNGRNFSASADRFEAESLDENSLAKPGEALVRLEGHAVLELTARSGGEQWQASRIEFRPTRGMMPNIADAIRSSLEREMQMTSQ